MTSTPSVEIGVLPWETHIASSTNPCMVGIIDGAGDFKPYCWKINQCIHTLDTSVLVVNVTDWSRVWLRKKNQQGTGYLISSSIMMFLLSLFEVLNIK